MIACGHCNARHSTVREVRECSLQTTNNDFRPNSSPSKLTEHPAKRSKSPNEPQPVPLNPDWQRLAGPDALGRNLVVNPGQDAFEPWVDCDRIVIEGKPGEIDRLRAFRKTRKRAVIELRAELRNEPPVLNVSYWHLSPKTDLEGETLDHLVFDHSVDAREPDRPTIRAVSLAVRSGARLLTQGLGDVETKQGKAWCDGGPLEWFDDNDLGAAVIPVVHLNVGSTATIRNIAPNADLADDQLQAVAHSGGGARIIAPAGSGKTRVLTERARHLIQDRGIDPATVCLVAYNVRARAELQERTRDLAGLQIRTLNSLALAILRGSGPFRTPTARTTPQVINEPEVRKILSSFVGGRRVAMADPFAVWIEALTATRMGLRPPSVVEQEFAGEIRGFADALPQFRAHLNEARVVDFDEQILGAIEVLCTDPAARQAARRVCGVLLVDEFQDLTPAHVLLIRLLAGPAANVFGVGDDDQTIYGYAGASPSWLIDFADLFAGSAAHDLQVNYRCGPKTVEAASTLLTHNRRRVDKTINSRPGRVALDNELDVLVSRDPLETTINRVAELLERKVPPADIAVLARVNATLLGPMILLEEDGISTNRPVDSSFMERTGVAAALAWLTLAVAPERSLPAAALETAVRRPPRGLSGRLASWVGEQRSPRQLRALAGRLNQERDQLKIMEFTTQLEALRRLAASNASTVGLLTAIRDDIGLGRALDNRLDASRRSVDRSAHGDDLAALLSVATRCADPFEFPRWLTERLDSVGSERIRPANTEQTQPTSSKRLRPVNNERLRTVNNEQIDPASTEQTQPARAARGRVTLSTVHRVKGREWPHVIVHDVGEGLMPHRLSADTEEERRVFHVAITRASETVTLVAGHPPSKFLTELHTAARPQPSPRETETRHTPEPTRERVKRLARSDLPEAATLDEARLRERLKTWRLATAKAAGKPAFVVLTDATLYEVAACRPQTNHDLLQIRGIGNGKVSRYGDDILKVVNQAE